MAGLRLLQRRDLGHIEHVAHVDRRLADRDEAQMIHREVAERMCRRTATEERQGQGREEEREQRPLHECDSSATRRVSSTSCVARAISSAR